MIKQSSLLKWPLSSKSTNKGTNRNWIHPPEALQSGHVAYLVKFLGKTEASKPKGIEVVKESIQKLKFTNQLKQSEGNKIPKIELTVSIDGVALQDPKTKQISYQYPLHLISYCADDKSDKKLFSFIAKEPSSDKHTSFVFASDKLAEEITLTIGQAFELAYRRFLDTSGRELEMKRRVMILQKRVQDLEAENKKLHEQLANIQQNKLTNDSMPKRSLNGNSVLKINTKIKSNTCPPVLQPPPPHHRHTSNRNITQNLLGEYDELPKTKENYTQSNNENDPFGMGNFALAHLQDHDLKNAISEADKRLLEMQDGFNRGLSFGNDDFSADCIDVISK